MSGDKEEEWSTVSKASNAYRIHGGQRWRVLGKGILGEDEKELERGCEIGGCNLMGLLGMFRQCERGH